MNYSTFIKLAGAVALIMVSVISNVAIAAQGSNSQFTVADFRLNTAQELVDVCLVNEDSEHHDVAMGFCYGFFEGAVHYDEAISRLEWYQDLVCPPPGATRQQGVAIFLDYLKENPQYGSEQPVDTIFRSLVDKWPCIGQ